MKIYNKICLLLIAVVLAALISGCSFFEKKSLSDLSKTEPSTSVVKKEINAEGKNLYGYDSIDDSAICALYAEIDAHIDSFEITDLRVDGVLSSSQILQAVAAYKEDHPEKFWLKSSVLSADDGVSTYIDLEYTMEQEELIAAKKEFKSKIEEIVASAPENASDYELEIYIHDYLVKNCTYDKDAADDPNPKVTDNAYDSYGTLVEGSAVCEGYARAFSLLCREFGIDCVCVSGIGSGEGHMWNCISLDGEWYNVDVTWDDPDSEEEDLSVFKYVFLNMSDEMFRLNHKAGDLYKNLTNEEYTAYEFNCNNFVPVCSSDDYYYYYLNGTQMSSLDDNSAMSDAVALAASEGSDYIYFVIDSSLDFEETYNELINGKLSDWIYQSNSEYGLSLNPQTFVYAMEQYHIIAAEIIYQ